MYRQKHDGGKLVSKIAVKHGRLQVGTIRLTPPHGIKPVKAVVLVNDRIVAARLRSTENQVIVELESPAVIAQAESLSGTLT